MLPRMEARLYRDCTATVPRLYRDCTVTEEMLPRMEAAARRGYVAVAIDARFHGGRAEGPFAWQSELTRAWRSGGSSKGGVSAGAGSLPAVYALDTVWDLVVLLDYLETRPDVDPNCIGVTGV
eukprot:5849913-Pyramimonas_sp.AAC.1